MGTSRGSSHLMSQPSRQHAGARVRARAALALLLVLAPAPARADDIAVAVEGAHHGCRVRGSFQVPVSTALAWNVLADYDHIGDFVRSMRSSRIEYRDDGQLRVRQEAVGGVFLFRRRVQVLLEVHEEPIRRIAFHDVLGKDFRDYAGEWRIATDSTGTRVDYELAAEPRAAMARAFCRGALRNTARDLLEQVRAEMIRRAAAGAPTGGRVPEESPGRDQDGRPGRVPG